MHLTASLEYTCSLRFKAESYTLVFMVQMGKDVVSFLSWAAEPEMEERKLVCWLQIMFSLPCTI